MGLILWIILGAICGWIASMIVGTNARQGWLENIVVGIVGAFIGGIIGGPLFGHGVTLGTFDLYSIILAIVGAIILLLILRAIRRA
jgi:uncharacterized membrane protein YeaQ/YmgE (transglycosylase-associated protein family)